MNNHPPLVLAISVPRILAALVSHLPWHDLHSLLSASSSTRSLFRVPALRDPIIARFVPLYRSCLRHPHLRPHHPVPISIHHLDLFLISQKYPLHLYPTHALRSLSSLGPSPEQEHQAARLAALALAHSRFVLLLQSLVHSIPNPPPASEPRTEHCSKFSAFPSVRQLSFPAPLSYSPPRPPKPPPRKPLSPSFSRRLSIFSNRRSPSPPPPAAQPNALKAYSSSWRRSLYSHRQHASLDYHRDFSIPLKRPHRQYVSTDSYSSSASASPRSGSRSSTPSPRESPTPVSSSATSYTPASAPIPLHSPHALTLATSRVRAPVLRVYAPTTALEPSILACEQQLVDTGLWDHLSTGDIVCNLGYVPPSDDADDIFPPHIPPPKWLVHNGAFLVPYTHLDPVPIPDPLTLPSPFYYAHIAPPAANPVWVLRGMPSVRRGGMSVDELGQVGGGGPVTMQLVHLPAKVRSPHSPAGYAVARKWMWTARVTRREEDDDEGGDWDGHGYGQAAERMGEGWYGEWVLEGEGTCEGRAGLLAWLGIASGKFRNGECAPLHKYDGPPREWEFVRERSGAGRIWLRLLHDRDVEEDDDLCVDGLEVPGDSKMLPAPPLRSQRVGA